MLNKVNQAKKEYILYNSIYVKFNRIQTNLEWQGTNQWLPEGWEQAMQGTEVWGGRIAKRNWNMMDIFTILIAVLVSWVYTYIKIYLTVYFNMKSIIL